MRDSSAQLQTVNVRVAEGAATIELNRPEALSAWNRQFGEALREPPGLVRFRRSSTRRWFR